MSESFEELQYLVNSARLHNVEIDTWKAPVLEVWAEWGLTSSPRDRDRDRDRNSDRDRVGRVQGHNLDTESIYTDVVPVISKRFLGLTRYNPQSQLDHTVWLPVSLLGLEGRGPGSVLLVTSLHLGERRKRAEKLVLDALSSQLDWNQCLPRSVPAEKNLFLPPTRNMCDDDEEDSHHCLPGPGTPGQSKFLVFPMIMSPSSYS